MNAFTFQPTTYGDINSGRAYYNGGSGGQTGAYMPTNARQAADEAARLAEEERKKREQNPAPMSPYNMAQGLAGMGNTAAQSWLNNNQGLDGMRKQSFASGGLVRSTGYNVASPFMGNANLPPGSLGAGGQGRLKPYRGMMPATNGLMPMPMPPTTQGDDDIQAWVTDNNPFAGGNRGPFAPSEAAVDAYGSGNKADPFSRAAQAEAGRGFAEGGRVVGPGGPTDDMVPAMIDGVQPARLSDGEFVMPEEAVRFFGLDKLNKMRIKAKEGLMQIPDGERMEPGKGQMPMLAMGGMVRGYAEGGPASNPSYDNFEAMKSFYQDPRNQLDRQMEAAAAAAPNTIDAGGGARVLAPNPYGTGFAVPGAPTGAGLIADENGLMRNTGTPRASRLETMPDVVESGPWATGGAMPDLGFKDRTQSNQWQSAELMKTAPHRKFLDQYHREQNYSALVPNTGTTMPQFPGTPAPQQPRQPFLSPSEKRDQDRADQLARDAAEGRPDGMRQTDWQRMRKDPRFIAERAEAQAAGQWAPVPGTNYVQNGRSQTLPKADAGTGNTDLPKRIKELDAIMADKSQPLHLRELARREKDGAARAAITGTKPQSKEGRVVMSGGKPIILNPDGTFEDATDLDAVTDDDKSAAFKKLYGRAPAAEADWSKAWYLAREQKRASRKGTSAEPAKAGTTQPGGNLATVTSKADYDALPPGTAYIDSFGKQAIKR